MSKKSTIKLLKNSYQLANNSIKSPFNVEIFQINLKILSKNLNNLKIL